MSNSNHEDAAEGAAESALRKGLKVNVLSDDAMQRIRHAAENEWRATTQEPVKRRPRYLAIAASLAGIVGAGIWTFIALNGGSTEGAVLGQIAGVDSPGIIELRSFAADTPLTTGTLIRGGQRLDSRGNTVIDIEGGGNLRVARASLVAIEGADVITLSRGELYVDIPPGSHAASSFRVLTGAGEFRHDGTQFAVMSNEGQTRLRVREGYVVWRVAGGESTIPAGMEVTIDRNGQASKRPIPTAGRDWAWTETMAPSIAIESRPLIEFLQWFARETGRKLEMDDASRKQAASILMHGSVQDLTVTEALSAVMATTTTLKYELPEGVLRVSSARDVKHPRT